MIYGNVKMPDQLEFDFDVFISYSNHDKHWVRGELLTRIEEAGLRAFIDFRDFTRGAPSIKECERGVEKCRKTLIVLTPDYIASEWCEIENIMTQTLSPANRDLRLIPLLKMPCEKPLRISGLTHIDFTDGADFDLAWQQLLAALDARQEESTEQPIPPAIKEQFDKVKSLTEADKYSEAIPILEKLLTEADESDHTVASVKTRLSLANALYFDREDFSRAEQLYRDALVLVPTRNLDLKHRVLHGLGDMLYCSGQLDEAKASHLAALDVAKLSGNKDAIAASLISLSLLERALGLNDSAMAKLDEAVQLLLKKTLSPSLDEKKHTAYMLAACYMNKALLCRDAGDIIEALAFCGRAEEQYRISEDKLEFGKSLIFFGEMYCANANWEKGLDCFDRALEYFKEIDNPLQGARSLESIACLYATHEKWEEALVAILGSVAGAEKSGHFGDQIHFLLAELELLLKWKAKAARDNVGLQLHKLAMETPEGKHADLTASMSEKFSEINDYIERTVKEDQEVRDALKKAKDIAIKERLQGHLADCLLDEARLITPSDDTDTVRNLTMQAIELLKEELTKVQFPKRRAHLMGRISALYRQLGKKDDALFWLRKAGDIFEKSGDVFGLAHFYCSLAEYEGRLDDTIVYYRKVLSLIEGRSFWHLAAGIRINLAAALQIRRDFSEAQKLLNEAEILSCRHHFRDLINAIAQIRYDIEKELQAAQAPTCSFPELISSFHQLIKYSPEHAVAYLPFWYFAWQTELVALVRSGPHLSFMVITDNVERFIEFAAKYQHLAKYFLLTETLPPKVKVDALVLPIPPKWLFPGTFPFLVMKKGTDEFPQRGQKARPNGKSGPPNIRLVGQAFMLPPYMMVGEKSAIEGEGRIMAVSTSYLPQQAIDLMINKSEDELVRFRAVWFPTSRINSKDPFLTDLRTGYERGVIPVYFDDLPTSEGVSFLAAVEIAIPADFLNAASPSMTSKWSRALLKLTKLPRNEAQVALLDLPEVFGHAADENNCTRIEIHLFEFDEIDQRILCPAILVKNTR